MASTDTSEIVVPTAVVETREDERNRQYAAGQASTFMLGASEAFVSVTHARRKQAKRRTIVVRVAQVLVVAIALCVLQYLVGGGHILPIYAASPTQIVSAFGNLVTQQNLFGNWLVTIEEAVGGVAIAFVLGVSTGVLMGLSPTALQFLKPFVTAGMAVPKVVIIPLLALYFGIGEEDKVVIVVMFGFFLFVFNTISGIRQVQESHLKVARAAGASRAQLVFKVVLPSAAPNIMTAVRIEATMALVAALFGEMLAAKAGLGTLLERAAAIYNTPQEFALIVAITVYSIVVMVLVDLLERKVVLKWKYV
jgi:NitT/TauT family transport system permease protein